MTPPFTLPIVDDVMETLFPKGRSNSLRIFSERELAQINGDDTNALATTAAMHPTLKPSATTPSVTKVRRTATPATATTASDAPFKGLWRRLRTLPSISQTNPATIMEKPAPKKRMEWHIPETIQRLEAQLIKAPAYSPQPVAQITTHPTPTPQPKASPSVPENDLFAAQARPLPAMPAPSTTPFQHLSSKLVTTDAVNSLLATARLDEMAKDQANRLLERNKFLSSSINNLAENYFRLQRDAT